MARATPERTNPFHLLVLIKRLARFLCGANWYRWCLTKLLQFIWKQKWIDKYMLIADNLAGQLLGDFTFDATFGSGNGGRILLKRSNECLKSNDVWKRKKTIEIRKWEWNCGFHMNHRGNQYSLGFFSDLINFFFFVLTTREMQSNARPHP